MMPSCSQGPNPVNKYQPWSSGESLPRRASTAKTIPSAKQIRPSSLPSDVAILHSRNSKFKISFPVCAGAQLGIRRVERGDVLSWTLEPAFFSTSHAYHEVTRANVSQTNQLCEFDNWGLANSQVFISSSARVLPGPTIDHRQPPSQGWAPRTHRPTLGH
jgi:hypothetical protein